MFLNFNGQLAIYERFKSQWTLALRTMTLHRLIAPHMEPQELTIKKVNNLIYLETI